MKKFISAALAFCLAAAPAGAAEVEKDAALSVAAICDNESIEVGDQFLVKVMLDGDFEKYLTYSVSGSFDNETAELIAPVYKDDGFSIVYNEFSNEDGSFQFDAADIARIEGSGEPLLCSLLFKAKKAGEFELKLGKAAGEDVKFYVGRAGVKDGRYDYDFTVNNFKAEISEDSDKEEVVIIKEKERLTPYDDMEGYEWAEIAVGAMARLGVTDGMADKSFEPAKSVTRGEFTAMLVRGAKLNAEGSVEGFEDVPEDYPYAEEIKIAKQLGVAKGDENGLFKPDDSVSRQDICALVYRALKTKNKIKSASEEALKEFPDSGEISDYAVSPMSAIVGARLIKGDDSGRLLPKKDMTRAEAAVLMESVIIHIKISR